MLLPSMKQLKNTLGTTFPDSDRDEGILLGIKVPKGSEKMPLAAEQMFAALHGLLRLTPEEQEYLAFEISGRSEGIFFYCWIPAGLRNFVQGQIYAQYPNAEIKVVEDYATADELSQRVSNKELHTASTVLRLAREDFFPVLTFPDFEVDPLAGITGALAEVNTDEQVWVQLLIRPVGDVWQEAGHAYVEEVRTGGSTGGFLNPSEIAAGVAREFGEILMQLGKSFFHPEAAFYDYGGKYSDGTVRLSSGQELALESIERKLSRLGFEAAIRVVAIGSSIEDARSRLRAAVASFRQFSSTQLNSFESSSIDEDSLSSLLGYQNRRFPKQSSILTTEELASVFHLPNVTVETPAISWSTYRKGEPPLNLPVEDCTYFAKTTFRDRMSKFGIKRDDRRRHFYAVGKTGCGKSTMFENMAVQDMENGEGVAVLDPLGDTVEHLLERVPGHRVDDVVIFDPSDYNRPVALNLLECPEPTQKNLMGSGIVDAFKKHFSFSWGPRLEYLLNNSILTLLEVPNTTILGITRLLSDINYQKYIVYQIEDPVLREFWMREYKDMRSNQRLITEAVAPIQNKVGRFLGSTTIRNIVGQAKSTIDLWEIMNEGKILFVNLSKGKIGADNANLLGSLLISRLNFMAMRRAHIPESERRDFNLYVDEFQNFASGSFASILSEARKYHLCLHLTHQYIAQIPEEMRDAVFGNIGTTVAFGVGGGDAEILATEFAPVFEEEDLISLERYNIYVKLLIDGMSSRPFSAVTLPRMGEDTGNKEEVVERSRQNYGVDVDTVERRIEKWMEREFNLGMAKAEEARGRKMEAQKKDNDTSGGSQPKQIREVDKQEVKQQKEIRGEVDLRGK